MWGGAFVPARSRGPRHECRCPRSGLLLVLVPVERTAPVPGSREPRLAAGAVREEQGPAGKVRLFLLPLREQQQVRVCMPCRPLRAGGHLRNLGAAAPWPGGGTWCAEGQYPRLPSCNKVPTAGIGVQHDCLASRAYPAACWPGCGILFTGGHSCLPEGVSHTHTCALASRLVLAEASSLVASEPRPEPASTHSRTGLVQADLCCASYQHL